MRIGIICPSEIAFRRFMPSLMKDSEFVFIGLGVASKEEAGGELISGQLQKAQEFIKLYNGVIFNSYFDLVSSKEIDAVYLPLPPALHYKWALLALENNKHVLLEKPSTTSLKDTEGLIKVSKIRKLALHENYMFVFHKQIEQIKKIIESGEIGFVRLYRISFGFPMRSLDDFRYNKSLGGGALLDAGGYAIKYASILLGDNSDIVCAKSNFIEGFEVDMFGSATLINNLGVTAQVSFGIDNQYKCELEVWGSKGSLYTNRVLTAPDGYVPEVTLKKGNEEEKIILSADDAFFNSIQYFKTCVKSDKIRNENYEVILKQSVLIEKFKEKALL